MIEDKSLKALKEYFKDVNPLIFLRSTERAKTETELFDILHGIPKEYPIVWDENERSWVTSKSLYLEDNFEEEEK
jgi:hypothetical protein